MKWTELFRGTAKGTRTQISRAASLDRKAEQMGIFYLRQDTRQEMETEAVAVEQIELQRVNVLQTDLIFLLSVSRLSAEAWTHPTF